MNNVKQKIILVEDNPDHVEFIRRALGDDGILLIHVTDTDSARQSLEDARGSVSLVLLDIRLPKQDGLELLIGLRKDPRFRELPVVVFSSSQDPKDVYQAYRLGANSYVSKPADFEEFVKKVRLIRDFWLYASELPVRLERQAE